MEILERLVVCVNDHSLSCKITPPLHAKLEDGQKFSISGAIVEFSAVELLAPITHRMQDPLIGLHQGCTNSSCTCVCGDYEITVEIGKHEDRGTAQSLPQGFKTRLLRVSPDKRAALTQQSRDWCRHMGEVANEPMVIICETEKLLDGLEVVRWGPSLHRGYLIRIYPQFSRANHMSKILQTRLSECTFLAFCKQRMLLQLLEHPCEVHLMLIFRFTVNNNIIEIN